MWRKIASGFEHHWQFPNCLGAVDDKHITIEAPINSGSQFFNYKKINSIVLMAIADAQYNFIIVDIGAYGSQSNSSIFARSRMGSMVCDQAFSFLAFNSLPVPRLRCYHTCWSGTKLFRCSQIYSVHFLGMN